MHDRLNSMGWAMIGAGSLAEWLARHLPSMVSTTCAIGGLCCLVVQTYIRWDERREARAARAYRRATPQVSPR